MLTRCHSRKSRFHAPLAHNSLKVTPFTIAMWKECPTDIEMRKEYSTEILRESALRIRFWALATNSQLFGVAGDGAGYRRSRGHDHCAAAVPGAAQGVIY